MIAIKSEMNNFIANKVIDYSIWIVISITWSLLATLLFFKWFFGENWKLLIISRILRLHKEIYIHRRQVHYILRFDSTVKHYMTRILHHGGWPWPCDVTSSTGNTLYNTYQSIIIQIIIIISMMTYARTVVASISLAVT